MLPRCLSTRLVSCRTTLKFAHSNDAPLLRSRSRPHATHPAPTGPTAPSICPRHIPSFGSGQPALPDYDEKQLAGVLVSTADEIAQAVPGVNRVQRKARSAYRTLAPGMLQRIGDRVATAVGVSRES